MAEEWDSSSHAALSTYRTALSSINLFLLLDLLGTSKPTIPSYFKTTHWAYQEFANIELRLRSLGLLGSDASSRFLPESNKDPNAFKSPYLSVQDDHIPFLARGVEILHIIPSPFPSVWHTMNDDGEHLDIPTVEDWAKIVTTFAGEWMDLEGYFPPKQQAEATIKANRKVSRKTEL